MFLDAISVVDGRSDMLSSDEQIARNMRIGKVPRWLVTMGFDGEKQAERDRAGILIF